MEPSRHGKHSAQQHSQKLPGARARSSRRPWPTRFAPVAIVAVACTALGATYAVRSLNPTGTLSAASSATGPQFGVSASSAGALARSTAAFGQLPIIRVAYAGLPAANTWTTGPAGSNHSAVVISFRAQPRQILSGADDSALSQFFSSAPEGNAIYWSYFPQPEASIAAHQFTAARYRTAWAHIAALASKANNPALRSTLILRARDVTARSGVSWKRLLPAAGVISTLSWNAFPPAVTPSAQPELTPPARFMGPAVAAARSVGLPFGFSAFGLTTQTGRAAWLKKVADYLTNSGSLYGVLYSSPGRPATELGDASSIAAWRSIVGSSGSPAAPVPSSPVPSSSTPAPAPTSPTSMPTTPTSTPVTPTPVPTTPIPTTPTPTPTNTSSGPECVTSEAKGTCGPYRFAAITDNDSSNTIVGNDVWAPVNGWSQTLHVTSPGNWHVVANMPKGNTAVVSFPNVGVAYSEPALSGFSSIISSFTENMNASNQTSAWAAFDIWLNNWGNEVMISHDFAGAGPCDFVATATFGGSGGVPTQKWGLCQFGSELIWKLTDGNEQSGSVDVLTMLNWLVDHGYLPKSSTLTDISYGWEICSTGGQPETFTNSGFTLTTKH